MRASALRRGSRPSEPRFSASRWNVFKSKSAPLRRRVSSQIGKSPKRVKCGRVLCEGDRDPASRGSARPGGTFSNRNQRPCAGGSLPRSGEPRNGLNAGECFAKGIETQRAEVQRVPVERFQIEISALAPAGLL